MSTGFSVFTEILCFSQNFAVEFVQKRKPPRKDGGKEAFVVYYAKAQICLNGHIITDRLPDTENLCVDRCVECGAKTIRNCPECNEPINGAKVNSSVIAAYKLDKAPAYCHKCGARYPWTDDAIKSLNVFIDEEAKLSDKEKQDLKKSLPDIIAQTPKTDLAVLRVKQALIKASDMLQSALPNFIAAMACEYVKLQLGL